MDVTFWFDFGSPNAWFAHRVIPGIEQRTGATFTYVPVLLGGIFKATGNQAPMMAFAGIPAKVAYMGHEMQRFIRRHGLHQMLRHLCGGKIGSARMKRIEQGGLTEQCARVVGGFGHAIGVEHQ